MGNEYLDDTKGYLNEEERLADSWELLVYAHMLYNRVYVFKNFEAFSKSFHVRDQNDNPPQEYWEGLSNEKLIDQIKICTAFENYNKAVLLSRGFLVHNIDEKKNKELAKEQKLRPILISDFIRSNSFVKNEYSDELYLDGLKNFTTISFSRTLSPAYQEVIGLENRFLAYMKNLSEKRNRLHFYKNYAGAFRVETYLETLDYAKTYGTKLLKGEIDRIVDLQKEFD
jgi:hypothetical protein